MGVAFILTLLGLAVCLILITKNESLKTKAQVSEYYHNNFPLSFNSFAVFFFCCVGNSILLMLLFCTTISQLFALLCG